MAKTTLTSIHGFHESKITDYLVIKILGGNYFKLDHNNRLVLKFHHQYIPSEFGRLIDQCIKEENLPFVFSYTFNPELVRRFYRAASNRNVLIKMKKNLKAQLISKLKDDQNEDYS